MMEGTAIRYFVLLGILCAFSDSKSLNPIPGYTLVGSGWNSVTESPGLPIFKKTFSDFPVQTEQCGSETSHQGIFNCIYVNGTSYKVPHGFTAESIITGAKLSYQVEIIDTSTAIATVYSKTIVDEHHSLFESSTTTEKYLWYYFVRYKHSQFMAHVQNAASIYSLRIDEAVYKLLFLKGDTSYLDETFITSVNNLPDIYSKENQQRFFQFFQNYGIGFVSKALMGGKVKSKLAYYL